MRSGKKLKAKYKWSLNFSIPANSPCNNCLFKRSQKLAYLLPPMQGERETLGQIISALGRKDASVDQELFVFWMCFMGFENNCRSHWACMPTHAGLDSFVHSLTDGWHHQLWQHESFVGRNGYTLVTSPDPPAADWHCQNWLALPWTSINMSSP